VTTFRWRTLRELSWQRHHVGKNFRLILAPASFGSSLFLLHRTVRNCGIIGAGRPKALRTKGTTTFITDLSVYLCFRKPGDSSRGVAEGVSRSSRAVIFMAKRWPGTDVRNSACVQQVLGVFVVPVDHKNRRSRPSYREVGAFVVIGTVYCSSVWSGPDVSPVDSRAKSSAAGGGQTRRSRWFQAPRSQADPSPSRR